MDRQGLRINKAKEIGHVCLIVISFFVFQDCHAIICTGYLQTPQSEAICFRDLYTRTLFDLYTRTLFENGSPNRADLRLF